MEQQLQGNELGWWLLSHAGKLWLPKGEIPHGYAQDFGLKGTTAHRIGEWQSEAVWLVCQERDKEMASVRQLLNEDRGLFQLAGRAVQLAEFYRAHQFCGYCGQKMSISDREWACLCDHCRQRYYPQIAPCIIVAIRRDDKILLAQHSRHRGGIYTALAGFVEVGETLEQAVAREVMEESNLKIKNLRYISSQPWPFPHSLMMAYLADYESGELKIDTSELLDADWFHYEKLPQLPPPGTIARRLIEDTIALCRAESS
ncbi:NAD(+) diphosphatase [Pragia fontium]|uniref:NAD-capped RNA hydrolase NudC n=1 Tax=Pragia fontium DSM 5563 = ATCC 49100 TaxID=1122977 RepID=A0AAJ5BIS0_9GAMM|nr:NAD(+) diphosphatase [Pragia fontium]AKJ43350.1 NADH pyrophosphatase [Pragia fontium]SFD48568.1 NAD+ diphosphatase [Pragia fontium DSM 5563 = ATCC 49100]SUB83822.1 NADH pyrophosphatase [Pragia fontium]VEJ56726.1 NADH pyrophosphatase [Pragia fontium]